jgi:hypothetical protein
MTSQTVRDAARRRLSLGYPIKPGFGWRWKDEKDPNGRRGIEPDPATAEGAKLIVRLFLDGMATRKIAKELMARGVLTATGATTWSRKPVVDNLRQPLHYGLVRVREGEYVHGTHFDQRFFDPEDMERIAEMLEERTAEQRPVAMRPEYLLTGLAVCGHCGRPMRARQGRGKYRAYHCHRESPTETPECARIDCRAEWVGRAALEQVRALVEHPETLARARQEAHELLVKQRGTLPQERAQLQAEVQRISGQITRLVELLTQKLVEEREYRDVMADLRKRRQDLEQRLAEVQRRLDRGEQGFECWSRVEEALRDVARLWEQMTAEERRDLLGEIVERVEVTRTTEGGHELRVTLRTGQTSVTRIPPMWGQLLTPRQMAVLWLAGRGLSRHDTRSRHGWGSMSVPPTACAEAPASAWERPMHRRPWRWRKTSSGPTCRGWTWRGDTTGSTAPSRPGPRPPRRSSRRWSCWQPASMAHRSVSDWASRPTQCTCNCATCASNSARPTTTSSCASHGRLGCCRGRWG